MATVGIKLEEDEVLCLDNVIYVEPVGGGAPYPRKLALTPGKVYKMTVVGRHYQLVDDDGILKMEPKGLFKNHKGEVLLA